MSETIIVGRAKTRLEVPEGWNVVNIGAGPIPRANVYAADSRIKGWTNAAHARQRVALCNVCDMSFGDGEFQLAIVLNAAEQIEDPVAFCKELGRIAEQGYLEAVSPFREWLLPSRNARWLIGGEGEVLTFYPKPAGFTGYSPLFSDLCHRSEYGQQLERDLDRAPNITCTRFTWEGPFECQIKELSVDAFRAIG